MFCEAWPDLKYLIFTSNIPEITYYSHIPTTIVVFLLGFFVLYKSRSLEGRLLFFISLVFSFWTSFNLVLWVSPDSRVVMFLWSLFGILYGLISLLSFYFFDVFTAKKDISIVKKVILSLIFLPIIVFTSTRYNLGNFVLANCGATEGELFTNYYYLVGLVIFLWILILAIVRYKNAPDHLSRKKIALVTFGVEFFLLSFFSTSSLSSYMNEVSPGFGYGLEQYGLFGMTIFVGVLAYLIVKFKAFEIRLIGAQALMVSLVILVGSQFFFVKTPTNMVLTGITLALSIFFGFFLIKSVKSEIQRKEELQYMADKLAQSNDKLRQLDNAKTEFISIASHQLRTPLTAIKGFLALIVEGSYGDINSDVKEAIIKAQVSTERLINLVEDLLNVSRIESGRMEYKMVDQDITKLLVELNGSFAIVSKNKGLSFETKLPEEKLPDVSIDDAKMREVISNLIDNALKYTEKGGVIVRAEYGKTSTFKSYGENEVNKQAQQYQGNARPSTNGYVRVVVSDTGIGIPETELPYLFSKFSRGKDTTRLHVGGTGLGLYVGKNIVEAHGGKVWAESDGDGLGSRFIVELPVA